MQSLISIITPIYNQEENIVGYIKNLKKQSIGFNNIEIILVNDGSEDDSDAACRKISNKYKNVRYFCNEHRGVSSARNTGIKAATGKYIFFLDADDQISRNTIEDCVKVFDSIYDSVDLLTYPIETYYKGRKLAPHFRYRYLKENGIYDLTKEAFIGQTTMNIVVKNRFDNNVLFDETMPFSEDQKYCSNCLQEKLKMGFCKTASYIYYRSDESASGRLSGSCYVFETVIKMFEDIFACYEHVPVAFQGLFVHDMYWMMMDDMFFPYHYDSERFDEAVARVKALLRKCYNYVILDHPKFDYYEKFFFLRLKGEDTIRIEQKKNEIAFYSEGYDVFRSKSLEMVVTKIRIEASHVRIQGFLKSVFFQFYHGSIELYAIENETEKRLMELYPSAHSYYRFHEATQRFYAMEYECDVSRVSDMRFELKLGDTELPIEYYIMPLVPISKTECEFKKNGVRIRLEDRKWTFGTYEVVPKRQIWLYYDCQGVEIDNGLLQYLYDCKKNDDIERMYIITDKKQAKHIPSGYKTAKFGGKLHNQLLLDADKVITAFIENDNILPWPAKEYTQYANRMHFDTIYLQHGVLHAEMPWKYSPEKILADKVVISTDVDYNMFRKNGFQDRDLWKVGMPRFDMINTNTSNREKKILFAPSWRSYLTTSNNGHGWIVLKKKFTLSKYYLGLKEFLASDSLSKLLSEYGYTMDVKLHPIFGDVNIVFSKDDNIHIVDNVEENEYALFITDFSSYIFDFIYRGIPVLSYIPDYEEFTSGMNGYRRVDFMNKLNRSDLCKTPNDIIIAIHRFLDTGKGMDYPVEFYNRDQNSRESVYNLISH